MMQLFLCLVTPIFVLGAAFRQILRPGKSPTSSFGYRSTLAMMNVATWAEAQKISGYSLLISGIAGLLSSIGCYLLLEGSAAYAWSMGISAGFAVLTVPTTERRLSALFDEKGKKKYEGELFR
jgi:hypothetical protein